MWNKIKHHRNLSPYVVVYSKKDVGTNAIPTRLKFSAWICHNLFFNLDGLTWEMSKVASKFREENKIRFIYINRSLSMSGFYHPGFQTIVYSKMISGIKKWKRYILSLFANTVIYQIIWAVKFWQDMNNDKDNYNVRNLYYIDQVDYQRAVEFHCFKELRDGKTIYFSTFFQLHFSSPNQFKYISSIDNIKYKIFPTYHFFKVSNC